MRRRNTAWEIMRWLLVAIFIILYIPALVTVAYSFNKAPRGLRWAGFTLAWYRVAWMDADTVRATINTLLVSATCLAISVIAGIAIGYVVSRLSGFQFALAMSSVLVPALAPDSAISISQMRFWQWLTMRSSIFSAGIAESFLGASYVALPVIVALKANRYREMLTAAVE